MVVWPAVTGVGRVCDTNVASLAAPKACAAKSPSRRKETREPMQVLDDCPNRRSTSRSIGHAPFLLLPAPSPRCTSSPDCFFTRLSLLNGRAAFLKEIRTRVLSNARKIYCREKPYGETARGPIRSEVMRVF